MLKKSFAAALLISIGTYGLVLTNYSITSMILFSFGLFTICALDFSLFTGKCGYIIENNNLKQVLIILISNLIFAYIFGILLSIESNEITQVAISKIATWQLSFSYFLRSTLCGIIMFFAVDIYKKGSPNGIYLGIPLFILNGFQHCIANAVLMGVARDIVHFPMLILCIIGNWCGGLLAWYVSHNNTK